MTDNERAVLQQHMFVTEEPGSITLRLRPTRSQKHAGVVGTAFVTLVPFLAAIWMLFKGLVWGAILFLPALSGLWLASRLWRTAWGQAPTVFCRLTNRSLVLGAHEIAWETVEGVRLIQEGGSTFLELSTTTTIHRHRSWAPLYAHPPLVNLIQAHIERNRPALTDTAAPVALQAMLEASKHPH